MSEPLPTSVDSPARPEQVLKEVCGLLDHHLDENEYFHGNNKNFHTTRLQSDGSVVVTLDYSQSIPDIAKIEAEIKKYAADIRQTKIDGYNGDEKFRNEFEGEMPLKLAEAIEKGVKIEVGKEKNSE